MNVNFYINSSDKKYLSKKLTSIRSAIDCQLTEPCSVLQPRLVLARGDLTAYSQCNYMYIQKFKRYYYCQFTALPGDMLEVRGEVDVLMSFANGIRAITTTILRQENNFNNYFIDNQLPIRQTKTLQWVKVGTYNAGTGIYLTVDGGES